MKSAYFLCFWCRKNVLPSEDHDKVKEALLSERTDRPRVERGSIQKLKYDLDSGDNLLGDEVNKQEEVISGRP